MSSSGEDSGFHVRKLSSDNYHHWKFDMKMVLIGKDLWEIVTGGEVLAGGATNQAINSFRKRDNKALSIICLAIEADLKIYVRSAKSSKEAWDALENTFEEKTLSKIIQYRRKLYSVKLKEKQSMTEHVNHVKTLSEHLEALEDPVRERDLVIVLLSSLPEEYNNLITTLETLDEEKLTWVYVRDRVICEYDRKQKQSDHEPSKEIEKEPHDALLCGACCKKGGKFSKNDNNKNNNNNQTKFPCHYCQETGHYIKDCPKKKKDQENKENEDQDANFCNSLEKVTLKDDNFYPEFALHVEVKKEKERKWLLDSACSRHISGERSELVNYKKFIRKEEFQYVVLADKSIVRAEGQGDLNLYLKDEQGKKVPVTFKGVLYAPKFEKLISISQLIERGGEVTFKGKSTLLTIGGRRFQFGTKEGKLFKMNACNFANVISASEMEKIVSGSSEEEMNPSEEKQFEVETVSSEVKVVKSENQVKIMEGSPEKMQKIEENVAENPNEEEIETSGSKSPVGVEHFDFKWEKVVQKPKQVKSNECTEVNFCCDVRNVHLGAVGLGEIRHGAVAASRKAHSGAVGLCAIRFCATTDSRKVHPGAVGRKEIYLGAGGVSGSVHYSVVVRVISCDAALGGTTTSVLDSAWCGVTSVLGSAMCVWCVAVCSSLYSAACVVPLSVQPMRSMMQLIQFYQSVCVLLTLNYLGRMLAVVIPTSGSVRNIISRVNVGIPMFPRYLVRDYQLSNDWSRNVI